MIHANILLGINAGFGNSDCGSLQLSAVNLDAGWLDFPRPKTSFDQRCRVWPETVEALREALADRLEPKKEEHAGLVFFTKYGQPWAKDTADSPITFDDTIGLLHLIAVTPFDC